MSRSNGNQHFAIIVTTAGLVLFGLGVIYALVILECFRPEGYNTAIIGQIATVATPIVAVLIAVAKSATGIAAVKSEIAECKTEVKETKKIAEETKQSLPPPTGAGGLIT